MPDPPRVSTTSKACEPTLSGPSGSSRSCLRAGASERASWKSAWALSFLIKLGDHGLWVRLHVILATLATKVESSSLRGDLERLTHIAEVLAADGADRLLESEVLFGRRQSLDPGDLGVGELDRRAIVMGGVRLGAFQRGASAFWESSFDGAGAACVPFPGAVAEPAAAWPPDVSILLTAGLVGLPVPAVPAAGEPESSPAQPPIPSTSASTHRRRLFSISQPLKKS